MANPIQFANGPLPQAPNTTLTAAIPSSGGATPTVASAAFLPAAGPFLIVVDNERIEVDSISGTTLTILAGGRAQEGTVAAAHSSGASVYHVLSAGTLTRHIDDRAGGIRVDDIQVSTAVTSGTNVLTLVSETVTLTGSQYVEIWVYLRSIVLSVTTDQFVIELAEDGTNRQQFLYTGSVYGSNQISVPMMWVTPTPPAAGNHTYALTIRRGSGTGIATPQGAAGRPIQFVVKVSGHTL